MAVVMVDKPVWMRADCSVVLKALTLVRVEDKLLTALTAFPPRAVIRSPVELGRHVET